MVYKHKHSRYNKLKHTSKLPFMQEYNKIGFKMYSVCFNLFQCRTFFSLRLVVNASQTLAVDTLVAVRDVQEEVFFVMFLKKSKQFKNLARVVRLLKPYLKVLSDCSDIELLQVNYISLV